MQAAIQRTLRAAWGPDPPQVDLYLRTGCMGAEELNLLLPTVELFWPEAIGEVIIALDTGNGLTPDFFVPAALRAVTQQSYRFVHEEQPCMPGKVFNQVSYLNLDMHSSAQYIVTIDSDVTLHCPVTPDLLFDDRGKLLLPYSNVFQAGSWDAAVEWFTGPGTFSGHAMMTQPVSFARETFAAYRAWMAAPPPAGRGECLYDAVARYVAYHAAHPSAVAPSMSSFCWMCQLLTFLQLTHQTADLYNLVNTDDSSDRGTAYLRYGRHGDGDETNNGTISASHAAREGICRALGGEVVPACATIGSVYVDDITFTYAHQQWMANRPANKPALTAYIQRFRTTERSSRT